jgi:CBS-domain-containing membrane protein
MTKNHLKRVPVVDEAGHLIGIVTRSDLLRELTFSDSLPTWTIEGRDVPLGWDALVEQVMSIDIATVAPTTPLGGIIQAMLNTAQKRIIVTDEHQHVAGLITDGDLLAHVHTDHRSALLSTLPMLWTQKELGNPQTFDPALQTAADVMTAPVITVKVGTTACDALRLLMEHRIKRLPVVDEAGHVVGLVGRAGLMRALIPNAAK